MTARSMDPLGGALVASTAVLEGEFTLSDRVSVWWNAVLRGDDAALFVDVETNIQDLVMVHPDPGVPLHIGSQVTIGHGAVIHCAHVGDRSLIGIHAVLLAGARIGDEAVIAAGALVPEGMVVPPRTLVAGVPARVRRDLTDEECATAVWRANKYWREACARAGRR